MANQHQSGVVADLRWVYFRAAAGVALVMWAGLWLLGSIKYGPFATLVFVLASLGSVWLGAWALANRVAATKIAPDFDRAIPDDSKKAA